MATPERFCLCSSSYPLEPGHSLGARGASTSPAPGSRCGDDNSTGPRLHVAVYSPFVLDSRARLLGHPCAVVPYAACGSTAPGPARVSDAPQPPVPGCTRAVLAIPAPATVWANMAGLAPGNAGGRRVSAKIALVHSGTGVGSGGPASLRCDRGRGRS